MIYSIATKRSGAGLSHAARQLLGKEEKGLPDNFHKLRVFCKGTILAVLHLNPLYFFIALFCFELTAITVDYFLHKQEKQCPKL